MWFQFLTCLCVAAVVADRKTCQKVQVNNGRIRGECCIFTKETPKEELLALLDPKLTTEMMLQHEKHHGGDIFFPGIGPIPEFGPPQGPPPLKEYPDIKAASGEVTSQEKDDRSTEVISTTTIEMADTEVSSNNTGIIGKTIVDNRNAIDVPIVSCPPGQARSPSGDCIEEY